jgi:two-component system, chemotaxis family, protein-glutamate methylesterase/glutaminase
MKKKRVPAGKNPAVPAKIKRPAGKKVEKNLPDKSLVTPFVIAIGASAGGLNAISELVSQLSPDINASVLVVLHLSKAALGEILVDRVQKNTKLTCKLAKDKERLEKGHVYIAPPDSHLLVKEDKIVIGRGPAENRFRPSIDVLFRSVAVSHGGKAIGIVLTGMLNDGRTGMWAIRQSGGHCIVQDPNEAEFPDMPLAVLESMEVDHCVSLKKMGAIVADIVGNSKPKNISPPAEIVMESSISERTATSLVGVSQLGESTVYACPDCGGGLWSVKNGRITHFRCHVGHTYSEDDLMIRQSESIESTMWVALRMMEERKLLLARLAKQNMDKGLQQLGTSYQEQAAQLEVHIEKLKELLFSVKRD